MTAIASTLTNLILDTSNLLADPSGAKWIQAIGVTPTPTANPLQWYLNEAQEEFNRLTGIYRASASVTVTSGTQTVTVADANGNPPFGQILRIEDQTGKALLHTSAHVLDTVLQAQWKAGGSSGVSSQGQPTQWARGLDGFGTVRLIPTPNLSTTFTAYFIARPQMMTAGANYPFTNSATLTADNPAHYHYALPFYAAWKALTWNQDTKDMELANYYKGKFDELVKQAASEVSASMFV